MAPLLLMLSVVQLRSEGTYDTVCVACLSQLLVAGYPTALQAAWHGLGELLGFSSLLPEAIVHVQPMPRSHQQLCATVMWHQHPSGSGQPHGCGCQGCRGTCGLAGWPFGVLFWFWSSSPL